jgi:hypothetical protein
MRIDSGKVDADSALHLQRSTSAWKQNLQVKNTMKIRVTSVTSSEKNKLVRNATVALEDKLNPVFANSSYGGEIEQFTAVIVAVYSDPPENNQFCKDHNKIGSYKHPFTQEKVKFISFALPFDPEFVEPMTEYQIRVAICPALLNRLRNPGVKIPKQFDYARFAEDLQVLLEIYRRATFEHA